MPDLNATNAADRRSCVRQAVSALAYVQFGQENGGIILNLGEGGLAVAAAYPLVGDSIPHLRFRLPGVGGWVEASGHMAWVGESKKEAGIRFVDLTEDNRSRIRNWISSEVSSSVPFDPIAPVSVPASVPALVLAPAAAPLSVQPPIQAAPIARAATPVDTVAQQPVPSPKPYLSEHVQSIVELAPPRPAGGARRWYVVAAFCAVVAVVFFLLGTLVGKDRWADVVREVSGRSNAPAPAAVSQNASDNAAGDKASGNAEDKASDNVGDAGRPAPPVPIASAEATPPRADEAATPPVTAGKPALALNNRITPNAYRSQATSPATLPAPVAAPAVPVASEASSQPPKESTLPSNSSAAAAPALAPPVIPAEPPAALFDGRVEVSANPYPSLRVPADLAPSSTQTGTSFRLGQLTGRVEPRYPQDAIRQGLQGVIRLHAIIGSDGRVRSVDATGGPQILEDAARNAIGQWRYQQTFLGTRAVETETEITVTFRLVNLSLPAR